MPDVDVRGDRSLFRGDRDVIAFCDEYERLTGTFNRHFIASVPYIMENECRVGVALLEYAKRLGQGNELLTMFCLSNACGSFARTLSGMPGSNILTLTNSREPGCRDSFFGFGVPDRARFVLGTFLDVTPKRIRSDPDLAEFRAGFDIIYEHEAFQMFGNDRREQLAFVTRLLKSDGLMILSEKLNQEDMALYRTRERQKDEDFKARYFSREQIEEKQEDVVRHMLSGQVTLKELADALGTVFKHAVMVWNSTNFYLFVASNSEERILTLLEHMLPPCIPPEFCGEELPRVVLGMESGAPAFGREPTTAR